MSSGLSVMFSLQGPRCSLGKGVCYWLELNIRSLYLTDSTISQRSWTMIFSSLFSMPLPHFVPSLKGPGSEAVYLP